MRALLLLLTISACAGLVWYASAGASGSLAALDDWRARMPDWARPLLPAGNIGGGESRWKLGTVTRGPVQATVLATGTLKPVVTVEVGSQISGQIVKLEADFNTQVQEGQVLARLDPATYRARLEQARADLAVADATVRMQEAAIERARSQIEAAENAASDAARSLSRTEQLSRTGATSEKQLQADRFAVAQARIALNSSRAQLRIAQAEVAVAQGQVQQRRAAVAIAETDLERTIIRSPVRGVVVNRNIDNGQTVAASLQAPLLFEIAQDLADMRLEASVDEADVGRVREGQRAFFGADAHPGRVFHGRVVQVRKAPKLIQNVTTYAVVIDVENPDLALFPGMTANVRIVQSLREDAVKVPLAALRFSPLASAAAYSAEARSREERGGSTAASGGAGQATRQRGAGGVPTSEGSVYTTDEDGSARRVAVLVGLVGDSDAEIVSGLTAGEAIIVGHADRPPPHAARPAAAL